MSKWTNQQQTILAHLRSHHSITTLEAREMFIMSPASRIMELKKQGHNIVTHRIGKNRIAKYVLLVGAGNE
jgi:hypothetical protein